MNAAAIVSLWIILGGTVGEARQRAEVTGTMQLTFSALMELQPYANSADRFRDPKNAKVIERNIKTLARLKKHAFPKNMATEEPGAAAVVSLFDRYVSDIDKRFRQGSYEYARHGLRTVTGLCFTCHSRVQSPRDFEDLSKMVEKAGLSRFERAELLAATRQFDLALKAYEDILNEAPRSEMAYLEYTRSLRHALGIFIRVKEDRDRAFTLLERLSKRKDIPEFIQHYVSAWKEDVEYWKNDGTRIEELDWEKLLEKARELVERGKRLQSFPADENGDVSLLRASRILHGALDRSPSAKWRGEALYLLALCYYSLQDPMLWDLDGIYLEACIRENPKSDVAKRCYERYAGKVYMDYTGSSGTDVPRDELKRLADLRALAY